jgi:hypothetical protein
LKTEVAEIVELALLAPQSRDWRQASVDRITALTPDGIQQSVDVFLIREDRDR